LKTKVCKLVIVGLGILWTVCLMAILVSLLPPFVSYLESFSQTWVTALMPYMYVVTIFVVSFIILNRLIEFGSRGDGGE